MADFEPGCEGTLGPVKICLMSQDISLVQSVEQLLMKHAIIQLTT